MHHATYEELAYSTFGLAGQVCGWVTHMDGMLSGCFVACQAGSLQKHLVVSYLMTTPDDYTRPHPLYIPSDVLTSVL